MAGQAVDAEVLDHVVADIRNQADGDVLPLEVNEAVFSSGAKFGSVSRSLI